MLGMPCNGRQGGSAPLTAPNRGGRKVATDSMSGCCTPRNAARQINARRESGAAFVSRLGGYGGQNGASINL